MAAGKDEESGLSMSAQHTWKRTTILCVVLLAFGFFLAGSDTSRAITGVHLRTSQAPDPQHTSPTWPRSCPVCDVGVGPCPEPVTCPASGSPPPVKSGSPQLGAAVLTRQIPDLGDGSGGARDDLRGITDNSEPLHPPVKDILAGIALPRDVLARSIQSGGNARLRGFIRKLDRGEPVTVVLVGGSISELAGCFGRGCDMSPSMSVMKGMKCNAEEMWSCQYAFMYKLMLWINATWPHPDHAMFNMARGGSTSYYVTECFEMVVPRAVDLAVVEFNVNEDMVQYLESAARRILLLPSNPAIVFLSTYWWSRKPTGERQMDDRHAVMVADREGKNRSNETTAERLKRTQFTDDPSARQTIGLARYYDVSSVSVYAALMPELVAEQPGIFPVSAWTEDGIHPTTSAVFGRATGHKAGIYGAWMFLMLKHLFVSTLREPPPVLEEEEQKALQRELRPPLFDPPLTFGQACYAWNWYSARPLVHSNTSAPSAGSAAAAAPAPGSAEGSSEGDAVREAELEAQKAALGYPRGAWFVNTEGDKPGLVVGTGAVGAVVELQVDASLPAAVETLKSDPRYSERPDHYWVHELHVQHLTSWRDNMGGANLTCVSGCKCVNPNTGAEEPIFLDGRRRSGRISDNSNSVAKIVEGTANCIVRFESVPSTTQSDWFKRYKAEPNLGEVMKKDLQAMAISFRIADLSVVMSYVPKNMRYNIPR